MDIGIATQNVQGMRAEEQIHHRQQHRQNLAVGNERELMRKLNNPFKPHVDHGKHPRMIELLERFPPEAHNEMVMRDENIAALPHALDILQHITKIDISGNVIHELSPAVADIKGLLHLNISSNFLTTLPSTVNHMSNLLVLSARSNQLKKLPYFDGMYRLRELDLSNNLLEEVPKTLGDLKSLQILDVSYCQLRTLPLELCELRRSLRILKASYNFLFELPQRLGNLASLEELHLSKNRLRVLPTGSVENMTDLQILDVSHNFLTKIPKSIGLNHYLKNLLLGCNQIEELPRTTIAMTGLQRLDVSGNQLTRLPEITTLVNLTSLRVENNQIERLPLRLHHITGLTKLDARGNPPLTFPPMSIAYQGAAHIREWLREQDQRDIDRGLHTNRVRELMFALLDQCPDEWSLFESFEEFDLDKGKTLSLREFFAWIQTLDLHANHYSVESVQQLAAALDEDGCGFISFDEVLPVYQRFKRERQEAEEGGEEETGDDFLSKMKSALVDAEMNDAAKQAEEEAAAARARFQERQRKKAEAEGKPDPGAAKLTKKKKRK